MTVTKSDEDGGEMGFYLILFAMILPLAFWVSWFEHLIWRDYVQPVFNGPAISTVQFFFIHTLVRMISGGSSREHDKMVGVFLILVGPPGALLFCHIAAWIAS